MALPQVWPNVLAAVFEDAAEPRMLHELNAIVAKHTKIIDKRFILSLFFKLLIPFYKLQIYKFFLSE